MHSDIILPVKTFTIKPNQTNTALCFTAPVQQMATKKGQDSTLDSAVFALLHALLHICIAVSITKALGRKAEYDNQIQTVCSYDFSIFKTISQVFKGTLEISFSYYNNLIEKRAELWMK